MSDCESFESEFQSITPLLCNPTEELFDDTIPLHNDNLREGERPICSQIGQENKFEELVEIQLSNSIESKQIANPTADKPKRKFLKKGEGIARFNPGAKLKNKPVNISRQNSSKDEPMKRIIANEPSQVKRKPVHKRIPQIIQASEPKEKRPNNFLSPIPFTPPSNTNGTPLNTKAFEFQTPPLSTECRPKHLSFLTADDQLTDYQSDLYRVPSDDSVILGFMKNEREQQEDLKEFEALEALIEAHVNGQTSIDLSIGAPMDSPAFHALGKKAQEHFTKRKNSNLDTHIHSPISATSSTADQNPLDVAIAEDEDWDVYFGDEIVTKQFDVHQDLHQDLQDIPDTSNSLKQVNEKEVRILTSDVDNLIKERVEELESEISEYQRLNVVMKKQEEERKHLQNDYKQKLDGFEEFKRLELERMDKDFQTQMAAVKRERQRLEQYKQTYHSSESKLLKQEIEMIREQLNESQNTIREKDSKNRIQVLRLKDNIRQVEHERDELKEQITLMESLRLKQWETTSNQPQIKQPTQTNHQFESIVSLPDDDKIEYEDETTQIFSESSSSIDSNEQSEISIIENTTENRDNFDICRSYANSTAIPGIVDKLSERLLPDNSTEIIYFNNSRKVISPNGKLVTLYLSNGDIKTTTQEKTVYFHAENSTKCTKLKNGQEIYEYSTGQIETTYPDGSREIIFPDDNKAHIFPDGSEKLSCKDGTIQKKSADGSTTVIWHPDGYVDTLTKEFKKREFADGTCKIVFKDGMNETRYPGGRVRIKTPEGKIIHDGIIEK
ncbi:centromere protein J-like isoform X2 [Oopsacas minuta]|uniref:Centromere protein J-like isoform X2 n=1 Tax=Oopsacas minuta TaxID=111878 RepID=A0AAV7JTG0_9METZ|nr:centromere protein J-like isoform X2 [Oopsacas minuta]